MTDIRGRTVLVTGGASGIGRLSGRLLLERGAERLVIWDVQEAAMRQVVGELAAAGYRAEGFVVDMADPARIRDAVREMHDRGIVIDILVNNAGIIVGKPFAEHTADDIARTMEINTVAPMQLARALLPAMIARGSGHVVNIASAAGMVANPLMSAYCASKWAMIGWSDSLRLEMERDRTGVQVTTVVPYYISTGMFAGVRSRFLPILKPEDVTRAIVDAIARNAIVLRLPAILNLLPLLRGILPTRWFDRVVGEWMGVYGSMSGFRGRT
jgi:short-subunit dehydrogenase